MPFYWYRCVSSYAGVTFRCQRLKQKSRIVKITSSVMAGGITCTTGSAIDTHFCSPLKVNQPVQVLKLGYLIQVVRQHPLLDVDPARMIYVFFSQLQAGHTHFLERELRFTEASLRCRGSL